MSVDAELAAAKANPLNKRAWRDSKGHIKTIPAAKAASSSAVIPASGANDAKGAESEAKPATTPPPADDDVSVVTVCICVAVVAACAVGGWFLTRPS